MQAEYYGIDLNVNRNSKLLIVMNILIYSLKN